MTDNLTRRPMIGITIGRELPDYPEFLRIRRTYPAAVSAAGGIPILIPPLPDDQLHELLERLDGIVLPGGLDVEPARYNEAAHPTSESDTVLDALELAVATWAAESTVPTLGICRGQQVLNVALGGSLIQDLPSAGLGHPQSPRPGPRTDLAHHVEVVPDSRLAAIFGSSSFDVNSYHHQAVRRLGRGLEAVAWSPDGVVEGLESTEHPWLLTVQFHPEDLIGFHAPSQRLFAAFVASCADRSRRRASSPV